MSSDRRKFLKHAGISVAGIASMPHAGFAFSTASTLPPDSESGIDIDAAGDAARTMMEQPDQGSARQVTYDVTWPARVTGKHRAMFDVPAVEGGIGIIRAGLWVAQCISTLKSERSELSSVIVIRHDAIPLIMTQEFWTAYKAGEALELKDDKGKTMEFNPNLPVPGKPEPRGTMASLTLDRQIADGAIVLACDMAFRFITAAVARKDRIDQAQAREKAISMIVPGVILQPSGFFANVLAQEAGCVFVNAV